MHCKKYSSNTTKPWVQCPTVAIVHFVAEDYGGTLWTITFSTAEKYCFRGFEMAPGVKRTFPTEPRKLFCALLWTRLCPFTVSLSIRVSQPTKSLVTWVSIMNATFDYLCYSAAAHISLPATIHVWLDVLSHRFPPFKINCSVISPQDKKKSLLRT